MYRNSFNVKYLKFNGFSLPDVNAHKYKLYNKKKQNRNRILRKPFKKY